MTWERVPGKRDWTAEAHGCRFLLHAAHDKLWYAMWVTPDGQTHFAPDNPFGGPTALALAMRYLDTVAAKQD